MSNRYIPERFLGRTGYEIMVDRFCRVGKPPRAMKGRILRNWDDLSVIWKPEPDGEFRKRDFYGGNLKGITSKLDYIKYMGFNLIYLNPISYSNTNHHYDILDQTVIDPYIGYWPDFEELCQEAHKRDILIIVDLVFNHKSNVSESFKKAMKGDENFKKLFEWDEKTGKFKHWDVFEDMKQCNKQDPTFQEESCNIAKLHVSKGADGVRIDLGENFPKEFMYNLYVSLKAINPEVLIVNERWGYATYEGRYVDPVDTVMNYPATDALMRWVRWGNFMHSLYTFQRISEYPEEVQNVLWNHKDTHDTPRALTMLIGAGMSEDPIKVDKIWNIEGQWNKEDGFHTYEFRKWEYEQGPNIPDIKIARKKLNVASFICYNMRGIPFTFSGTELGVYGYKDPFNQIAYPWYIAEQIVSGNIKNEVFSTTVNLGRYRAEHKDILATGKEEMESDSDVQKIIRYNENGTIVTFANRTDKVQYIGDYYRKAKVIFNSGNCTPTELEPYGFIALRM